MVAVLIVSTSANNWGEGNSTGVWLEEVACPYYLFKEKGYQVDICSIAGGKVPIDAGSLADNFQTEHTRKFLAESSELLDKTLKLGDLLPDLVSKYSCIYLAGGHGTITDFPDDPALKQSVESMFAAGKVVAADCHGPVGFVNCKKPNGEPLVKGLRVTGFSNTEETQVGHIDAMKKGGYIILEDKFKEQGGSFEAADPWVSFAVADKNLVTGQNPQSSAECANKCMELIK
uniref:DJ-1/PfpI domain-containing protein n=1 Tax=Tetraselmis sp. GSL018 TaxID=582737 RepID=A0A061S0B3_9CHLO|mmetsp:Transcript_38488/g.91274  ORF Transcript_38488/g.91274 Transcript_38488/m.91274 type:complete len:231 (-) Transcript_38488:325-1017(-)